jgi:hypothetical protein
MRLFTLIAIALFTLCCKSPQAIEPPNQEAEQLTREGIDSRCYFGCLKRNQKMAMGIEQIKTECRKSCFIANEAIILSP